VLPATPLLLSVTVKVALRLPAAVGAKVMLIAQLAPGATEPAQVLVAAKSPPFAPPTVMLVILSVAAPLFERVTV
jgi:hypothetical protein